MACLPRRLVSPSPDANHWPTASDNGLTDVAVHVGVPLLVVPRSLRDISSFGLNPPNFLRMSKEVPPNRPA